MVQRKPARKKPKDPDAVPAGGGGAGPGSRAGAGGGGMAPAPLPNYMRATSCSGAKAGAAGAPTAPEPQPQQGRAKVVPMASAAAVPRAGRATCSSAMKGSGPGGPAHACPYAYCSFKGHAQAPPLGSFVAERRRLIKTQQSMKLKGASPFRKPTTTADGGRRGGYVVEIRDGATAGSDVSAEEMGRTEYVVFDRQDCGDDAEDTPEGLGSASVDGSCASSDIISVGSLELPWVTKYRGHKAEEEGEKTFVVLDHEDDDFGAGKSDISEELDAKHRGDIPEGGIGDAPKESSVDSISSSLSGISFEDVSSSYANASSSQKNRSSTARRRRTPEQGVKQMRPFKPRPPNFLPAETGLEAEKIDLKHQAVDDPRAAEEWMMDYALRKEVKKLARAQKRKVEMLVQAFESVLPMVTNDKKKPEQQDNGGTRTFTLAWPPQTCS